MFVTAYSIQKMAISALVGPPSTSLQIPIIRVDVVGIYHHSQGDLKVVQTVQLAIKVAIVRGLIIGQCNAFSVFSPSKVQGTIGECGVGGACSHIKAFWLSHFHIKGNSVLKACWADMP